MIPSSYEVIENADGSTTVVENWEPDYREEIRTRTKTIGIPFSLATTDLVLSLVATLAITVAAVFALQRREALPESISERASDLVLLGGGAGFEPATFGL